MALSKEVSRAARYIRDQKMALESELERMKEASNGAGYNANERDRDTMAGRIRGLEEAQSLLMEALIASDS